jgi:hypothetical protein
VRLCKCLLHLDPVTRYASYVCSQHREELPCLKPSCSSSQAHHIQYLFVLPGPVPGFMSHVPRNAGKERRRDGIAGEVPRREVAGIGRPQSDVDKRRDECDQIRGRVGGRRNSSTLLDAVLIGARSGYEQLRMPYSWRCGMTEQINLTCCVSSCPRGKN